MATRSYKSNNFKKIPGLKDYYINESGKVVNGKIPDKYLDGSKDYITLTENDTEFVKFKKQRDGNYYANIKSDYTPEAKSWLYEANAEGHFNYNIKNYTSPEVEVSRDFLKHLAFENPTDAEIQGLLINKREAIDYTSKVDDYLKLQDRYVGATLFDKDGKGKYFTRQEFQNSGLTNPFIREALYPGSKVEMDYPREIYKKYAKRVTTSSIEASGDYWGQRVAKSHGLLADKSIAKIDSQLKKYYSTASKQVISDFEKLYGDVMAKMAAGEQVSVSNLYNLDKYWQMQSQLKGELQSLGDKTITKMLEEFERNYKASYNAIKIDGKKAFVTIDDSAVKAMLKTSWCNDGKTFSDRVWKNTEKLAETLNNELVNCVATGKKPEYLKKALQERFDVSYSNADCIVRTEIAHIQTEAARQRYEDYGIKQVEVYVDEDERTCPICAEHEGERHDINDNMPVPFHPNCRCAMIPVIE